MIEYLSHALLIILSNVLTRKILIFYEFYACISISNADVSLSNSSSHAIRADVVVILGFRLFVCKKLRKVDKKVKVRCMKTLCTWGMLGAEACCVAYAGQGGALMGC